MNPVEIIKRYFTAKGGFVSLFGSRFSSKNAINDITNFKHELAKFVKEAQEHPDLTKDQEMMDALTKYIEKGIEECARIFRQDTVMLDETIKLTEKTKNEIVPMLTKDQYIPSSVKAEIVKQLRKEHEQTSKMILNELKEQYVYLLKLIKSAQQERANIMEDFVKILKKDSANMIDYYMIRGEMKEVNKSSIYSLNQYNKIKSEIINLSDIYKKPTQNSRKLISQSLKEIEESIISMNTSVRRGAYNSFQAVMREVFFLYVIQDGIEQSYKNVKILEQHRFIPMRMAEITQEHISKLETKLKNTAKTEEFVIEKEQRFESQYQSL